MKTLLSAFTALLLAFACPTGAEVIPVTVAPGQPVTVTVDAGSPETTIVVTVDRPADTFIKVTPGNDRDVKVRVPVTPVPEPKPTDPTTQPIPPPAPAYDLVITPATPGGHNAALRSLGSGTAAKPKTVLFKAGRYGGPLRPAGSFVNVNGEQVPNGDGTFQRPVFVGNKGDVYGLDYVWKGTPFSNLRYEGLRFQGFGGGIRFHADNSPAYLKGLKLVDVQCLDMTATDLKAGHGGFLAQIDGLEIINPFVSRAGYAKALRDIFTHGFYIQAGCKNVVVRDGLFDQIESIAVMARGPLKSMDAPDDGSDPGPSVSGNVILDAAVAISINGPRGSATGNVYQAGHFHNARPAAPRPPPVHGQGLLFSYCGRLVYTDNVRIGAPVMAITGSRMPVAQNNPAGKLADGWEWMKPTSYSLNARNIDAINKSVDLSDIPRRARAGEPVAKLVVEAQARVRKAAA